MVGQTVSHHCILDRLRGGRTGVVCKGEDTKLGRFVALKFLPEALAVDHQAPHPGSYCCVSGKVNSADKLYLVV